MAVLSAHHSTFARGPALLARALFALWALGALAVSATAQTREYQLKAAFLFQFTKFVEWPSASFTETNSPIVIGIVGQDPFEGALRAVTDGERVNGRPLELRGIQGTNGMDACHVVFISRSEAPHLERILAASRGKPLLTVSDIEGFALRGGVAELFVDENRIRFKVNHQQSLANQLVISSKLLRLAEVVRPER